MLPAVLERETGAASLEGAAAFGHRPHRYHSAALGDAGLARRLTQTAALGGHSGAVNAMSWYENGELLASGGEDCRLRLWRGADGTLLHSLDTGHTSNILAAAFLPGSGGEQLICCSADRQIRHLNIAKGAVRPYLIHQGCVRAVVLLDPHVFLSASEDGTVREFDVRQRPAAVHREALAGDDSNVLVDQRAERFGRASLPVGIFSLAIDEHRPWLMLTGGSDPLLRLYDRRMLPLSATGDSASPGGRGKASQWVACYAPSHIKAAQWDARQLSTGGPSSPGAHVTSVAFARGGAEVVGSYAGELIYTFDVAQHAREVEALLHIPETVLRAPARPRSHAGRRSVHGFTAGQQQPQWLLPVADAVGAMLESAEEGGGGTAPLAARHAGAALAPTGAILQQQHQQHRAVAGRGIAIAASVRQLEQQRRQQSRVAQQAEEPLRAESSRPAHWQLRPTSSTLRSPHNEGRLPVQQHHGMRHPQQQARHPRQPQELVSDSEGVSEGGEASPEGQQQQRRPGVRRSRRIMRRRRDAAEAEAAGLQQLAEDLFAEATPGQQQQQQQLAQQQEAVVAEVQQPAVSGVAEPASSGDSEDVHPLPSPATRSRRLRRRTLQGHTADLKDGGAYGAAEEKAEAAAWQQETAERRGGGDRATAVAGGSAEAAADAGGFKAPAGRSPQHARRRQSAAAAAAAAAMQRLDSTVGLLHHHPPQLEASEVAAGAGGVQRAQQEATVSMPAPHAGLGGAQPGTHAEEHWPSVAMEVSSRPLLSASRVGLGTQLGSQQAGHEASSLNSAEQPANELVGSVAQRARADAPSVGNAPAATTAAAAAAEARQAAADARQASTGHNAVAAPPPQFASADGPQRRGQAAAQQLLPLSGARQRQQAGHLQPTASTGTSRPPAFGGSQQQRYLGPQGSGRQASRLRRHSAGLDASQLGEAGYAAAVAAAGAAAPAMDAAMGSQALPAAAVAAAVEAEQQGQAAAPTHQQQQQPQPQATMLSGRGPSVLGDFMPGQEQPAVSEIQQRLPSGTGVAGGSGSAEERPGGRQAATAATRRQVDSAVGAIVHTTDADDGEEVSEPLMYRRAYAGHLNLSPAVAGAGFQLAPQLAFMGRHSELLVSPSDDGNIFIWEYGSGRLAAVLQPAAAPSGSSHGSADGGDAAEAAGRCGTCVAPHPLLPVLASGGLDPVVRLWSPEAEAQLGLEEAAAAVQSNLEHLAAAGGQPLGAEAGLADALLARRGGGGSRRRAPLMGPVGPPHCNTM